MTRNDFKELIYIKRRIADLKERRAELEATAEHMSINLSGMPSAHSQSDQMATFAAQVDAIDRKILEETIRLEKLRLEAEEAIELLPVQQKVVMSLRYVKGMSWHKVSINANYSIDHCKKIERNALSHLKDDTK